MDPENKRAYKQIIRDLEEQVPFIDSALEKLRAKHSNPLTISRLDALRGVVVNRREDATYEKLVKTKTAIQHFREKFERTSPNSTTTVKIEELSIKIEGTSGTAKIPNPINEIVEIDSSSDDDDDVEIISDSRTLEEETVVLDDDSDDESPPVINQSEVTIKKEILPQQEEAALVEISPEKLLTNSCCKSKETEITVPSVSADLRINIDHSEHLEISRTPLTVSKEISKVKDTVNDSRAAIICSDESNTKSQDEPEIKLDQPSLSESNTTKEITPTKAELPQSTPILSVSSLDINSQNSTKEEPEIQASDSTQKCSAANQNFNSIVVPPDGDLKGSSSDISPRTSPNPEASEDSLQSSIIKGSITIQSPPSVPLTSKVKRTCTNDVAPACPIETSDNILTPSTDEISKELSSPAKHDECDSSLNIDEDEHNEKSANPNLNVEIEKTGPPNTDGPVIGLVTMQLESPVKDASASLTESSCIGPQINSPLENMIATLDEKLNPSSPNHLNVVNDNRNEILTEYPPSDKNQQNASPISIEKSVSSALVSSSDFKETECIARAENEHISTLEKEIEESNNCNGELSPLISNSLDCSMESNAERSSETFTTSAEKKAEQDSEQFDDGDLSKSTKNSPASTPISNIEINGSLSAAPEDVLDESNKDNAVISSSSEDGTKTKTKPAEDDANMGNNMREVEESNSSNELQLENTAEISADDELEKLKKEYEEIKRKLIAQKAKRNNMSKEANAVRTASMEQESTKKSEESSKLLEQTTEKLSTPSKKVVTEVSDASPARTDSSKDGTDVVPKIKTENASDSKKAVSPTSLDIPIKAEMVEDATVLQLSASREDQLLSEISDVDADYVSLSLSDISYSDYDSGEIVPRKTKLLMKKRKTLNSLQDGIKRVVKIGGSMDVVSNKMKFLNSYQGEIEMDNKLTVTLKNEFAEKDLRLQLTEKQEATADGIHTNLKRKNKRKKHRNQLDRQNADDDKNFRKSLEEEEKELSRQHFRSYSGKTFLDEINSDSDLSLGPEEQRYGIRRISPIESRPQQSIDIDRSSRHRQIDEDYRIEIENFQIRRHIHDKDRKNNMHRRTDDENSQCSIKDDHDRKRKNRSPKSDSNDGKVDNRNRIRRHSQIHTSDDETLKKSFLNDRCRKYRRSLKHNSDDDRDDRHKTNRRPSRSPKGIPDREALESSYDDRNRRDNNNKDRQRHSDEEFGKSNELRVKHRRNRKRSREAAQQSPDQEISEKESYSRNKGDDNEVRSRMPKDKHIDLDVYVKDNEQSSRTSSLSKDDTDKLPINEAEKSSDPASMDDSEQRSRTTSISKNDISEIPKNVEGNSQFKPNQKPAIIAVIDLDDDRNDDRDNSGDDDSDKLGAAIEVSDDEILEAPPPPVINPSIDFKQIKTENVSSIEESNELETNKCILNADSVSKDGIEPKESDNVDAREISNSNESETMVIDVAEKQSDEAEIPMICDLTDGNVQPSTKPLEDMNLNELQEMGVKLVNDLGLSGDLLIGAINKTVETEYQPDEQIEPMHHLPQVNVTAQPSPNDPRLNRSRVPTVNPSPAAIIAPPPPRIPKLTPATALPSSVFVQVPYQTKYGQNITHGVANVPNSTNPESPGTYGEYKRMQDVDRRRKSVAEWEQEYNAEGSNAMIRFSKNKKPSRKQFEDELSNSSDDFSFEDSDDESSESESSDRSRKSSINIKSKKRLKRIKHKKWMEKFVQEQIAANLAVLTKKMSAGDASTSTKAIRNIPKKKPTKMETMIQDALKKYMDDQKKSSVQLESSKASIASKIISKPNKQITKVSGFLLPSVTQRTKTGQMSAFDRIKKNYYDNEKQKSANLVSGRQPSAFDSLQINSEREKQRDTQPDPDRHLSVYEKIKKNSERERLKSVQLIPGRPLTASKSMKKPESRIEKSSGLKRRNELVKLTNDIGKWKDSEDIPKSFSRRASSVMSEIKTKEMARTNRQLDENRVSSSESETDNINDTESSSMQTMSARKKRSAKQLSDDDEFIPSGPSLLTPYKEVPFAEKRRRKSNSSTSKKQKRNQIAKNTDISLHYNSPYMHDCVICKEKQQHIVSHYVNTHRENEVYVARLDVCQVKDLMTNPIYATPVTNSTVKFTGTCVFCLRTLNETMANFLEHFGSHTGEFEYECDSCELRFPRKRTIAKHCSTMCEKGAKMITVYCYDLSSSSIMAYICNICNFIQLNSANVVKHLRTEHEQTFVSADDYSPLTILEIRRNTENENEEDIEVANEAIESYDSIETNVDLNEVPCNANDNAQTEEVKYEITFDESDFDYLGDILNEPSPPDQSELYDSNELSAIPKQEVDSPKPVSMEQCNDNDDEVIFIPETASDEKNLQASTKYQKSCDLKPIITQIHSLNSNTKERSSLLDPVPITAQTIQSSNFDDGSEHDDHMIFETLIDMPEETATLPSLTLPIPSTSSLKSEPSNSLLDPTILRIMNVGFQKVGANVYKYYCLFENCDILSTENIDELRNHFKLSHDRKWGGKCNICSKRITKKPTSLDKEINHLLSHHIQKTDENGVNIRKISLTPVSSILKPWQEQPSKSRKSKEACNMLLKEYHLNLLYKCMGPECIYTNSSSSEMQLHITLHHSGDSTALECCYCERSFFSSVALIDHISKVHGSSNYQCSHCFYRSCAAYNVQTHQKIIHSDVKNTKILVCSGRGSTITTEIMEILENRQQNIEPINCPACRKSIFIKQLFVDHIKKSHPQYQYTDANFSTYECLYCIFGTSDLSEIRNHMSNKHPCRLLYVCGRVFIKDCHPLSLQGNVDITALKTTSLVYIGDVVNEKKLQTKSSDQLQNLGLIESVNSGQDAAQLNAKIMNTYGESVLNFNDVETYMEKLSSDIKPNSVCLDDLSELDQLVCAATIETGMVGKTLYRCGFPSCKKSVDNFSQFDRHISTHSSRKDLTYKCPHCNKNIPMNHIRLHTVQHRRHRYLCYYCADTSASQDLAISHLKTIHSHQCNSFVFLTTDKNWDRSSVEQEGRIFAAMARQDSESGDVVSTMTNVLKKKYDKTNANVDDNADIVQERPGSPIEQKEKILTPVFVSLDSRCICNIDGCPFRAKTEDELSQHFSERHLIILSGKYSCPHCSYNMDHSQVKISRIKKHLQYHGKKISLCNVCNYYHYDRDNVLRHIDTCHPYNFVTMDTATRTSLSTKHKIEILYSKNIRSAEDKYKCSLCEAILTECEEIYFHMKGMHQLNVRFGCDYPGCVFLDNSYQSVETHVKKNHSKSKIRIRGFFVPDGGKGGQASFELLLVETDSADITAATNIGHAKDIETAGKCSPSVSNESKIATKSKLPSKQKEAEVKEPSTRDKRKRSSESTKTEKDIKRSKPNTHRTSQSKDQVPTKNLKSTQIEEDKKPSIQTINITPVESIIGRTIPEVAGKFELEDIFDLPIPEPIPTPPGVIKLVPFERLVRKDIPHENVEIDVIQSTSPPPLCLIPSSPPHVPYVAPNHTISNTFLICHHCDDQSNDYNTLLSHYQSKHLGNPFHFRISKKLLCVYCHFISQFSEMKAHHLDKHPNYDFITRENDNNKKCAECSFEFNEHISELSAHSTTHHSSLYLQLHSSFCYINQQFLDGLLKLGEPSELFKCLICGNIYTKLSSCQFHIERSHSSSNAMENAFRMISNKLLFGCQHCQIFFETEKFAIKHIRKHLNPYGCNYCEIHFANHASLINHYNLLHHSQKLSYRSANILDNLKTFMDMLFLFPNGLILSKAETEFTDYGKLDQFKQMIESLEKVELQKWIEREEQNEVARIKRDLEMEGNLVCPEQ